MNAPIAKLAAIMLAIAPTSLAAQDIAVRAEILHTMEGAAIADGVVVIRDGKIARVTTYYNLTDWIAQVSG